MASEKYTDLARAYLLEEVEPLAEWLEANVKHIREEHGDGVTILITRNNNLDTGKDMWTYGNVSFDLTHGNEAL